jgi:hypothetical protein
MTDRRSFFLAGLAVFTVAAAMRTIPLYWSPLPHVLDGFAHAAHARATVATGHLPIGPGLRADLLVVTTFTAAASIVIGGTPLSVIQPLLSLAGAAVPLVGMAVARRLAVDLGWPTRRVRAAALATGLLLAVQGLFLRHTSIPDPEPLGQLFAFLAVLSLHRLLNRPAEARRWAVPLAVLLVSFPILHKFSTFNAALGVTALAGAEIARRPSRRTAGLGVAVAAAFWTAFVAYYELVERFGVLGVAYVSQVRSNPGLFVGWVVVLLVAVAWYGATSTRTRRVLLYAPVGLMFGLVGVNAVRPVFPGTIRSEPAVVAGVALLAVPVAFAGYAIDALEDRYETATLVTGLLAAPVVVALFALTAPLTPPLLRHGHPRAGVPPRADVRPGRAGERPGRVACSRRDRPAKRPRGTPGGARDEHAPHRPSRVRRTGYPDLSGHHPRVRVRGRRARRDPHAGGVGHGPRPDARRADHLRRRRRHGAGADVAPWRAATGVSDAVVRPLGDRRGDLLAHVPAVRRPTAIRGDTRRTPPRLPLDRSGSGRVVPPHLDPVRRLRGRHRQA